MISTESRWHPVQGVRRSAAIVFSDAVGYSRMMARDEVGTLVLLNKHHHALFELVAQHGGRVVNNRGDGVLIEFAEAVAALRCVVAFLASTRERNAELPVDRRMNFRIGVNVGEVLVDTDALHGDSVNVAARIQQLAEPGAINVTEEVRAAVAEHLRVDFVDLGFREVKGVRYPVHVWRVAADDDRTRPPAMDQQAEECESAPAELTGGRPAIAVLPFANLSGDKDQEYFASGVAEDIVASLARSSWLFVISHNPSFKYGDGNVDVAAVRRDLGCAIWCAAASVGVAPLPASLAIDRWRHRREG